MISYYNKDIPLKLIINKIIKNHLSTQKLLHSYQIGKEKGSLVDCLVEKIHSKDYNDFLEELMKLMTLICSKIILEEFQEFLTLLKYLTEE